MTAPIMPLVQSLRKRRGVASKVAWTPASISGLVAWYDASDAATITASGGSVSQWNDKSGNGWHLTQATGSKQPTTGTRTQNGLNVLDFDGSADALSSANITLAQPQTIVVVAAADTFAASHHVVGYSGGGGGQNPTVYISGGVWAYYSGTQQFGSIAPAAGVATLVRATFNGASSSLVVSGASASTGNPGASGYSTIPIRVGSQQDTSNYWDGWVAEVLFYDSALTGTDVTNLESHLNTKWAI